ncbi:MAG: helix-turn-helix domain-containing protein [Alphaproteobacteria bacterium]|nr:helix-turn-helix domain-containing protein [Alphaproteobacteria bacterium]
MAGKPVSQSSKNLGLRMKQILKDLKVSQEAAAFRLGLPYQSSLNHYLLGRSEIPINVIEKFLQEFKVPVNAVMCGEDYSVSRFVYDEETLNIMRAMDEFLHENFLYMKVEDKVPLTELFYKEKINERDAVFTAMTTMKSVNPEIFAEMRNKAINSEETSTQL